MSPWETELTYSRGDIHWVNLDPTKGSEIRKRRPCVLVGATPINQARSTVLVAPLSTSGRPNPPIVIPVTCIGKDQVVVCDQVRAVDKSRLGPSKVDTLAISDMAAVDAGLRQVLSL